MPFWKQRDDTPEESGAFLVVGLGNPGAKYEDTRHNIGFMVVDALARRYGADLRGSKHRADVARVSGTFGTVILAQPVTFMNDSGIAVQRLMAYYRVPHTRLIVTCDDLDIPFGTLRLRARGRSGGQRGLKSIIDTIGTVEFTRLRLGIGRSHLPTVPHVLQPFPPHEAALLPRVTGLAADAVESVVRDGVTVAMNTFNRNWLDDIQSDRGA